MLSLGKKLKELRKAENLTQQQVADKLNINRVNYNRYENDVARPDYETLIRIAEVFGVTLDEMLRD